MPSAVPQPFNDAFEDTAPGFVWKDFELYRQQVCITCGRPASAALGSDEMWCAQCEPDRGYRTVTVRRV